jgi:hypothetical protein
MNRTIIGKFSRQLIPLATTTQAKDDGIKRSTGINALTPGSFRWVMFIKNWLELVP